MARLGEAVWLGESLQRFPMSRPSRPRLRTMWFGSEAGSKDKRAEPGGGVRADSRGESTLDKTVMLCYLYLARYSNVGIISVSFRRMTDRVTQRPTGEKCYWGLTTMAITDIIHNTSRINIEDTDIFRTGFVLSTKYSVEFVG